MISLDLSRNAWIYFITVCSDRQLKGYSSSLNCSSSTEALISYQQFRKSMIHAIDLKMKCSIFLRNYSYIGGTPLQKSSKSYIKIRVIQLLVFIKLQFFSKIKINPAKTERRMNRCKTIYFPIQRLFQQIPYNLLLSHYSTVSLY